MQEIIQHLAESNYETNEIMDGHEFSVKWGCTKPFGFPFPVLDLAWTATLSPSIGHRTFQFDLGKGGLGAEGAGEITQLTGTQKPVFSWSFWGGRSEGFCFLILETLEKMWGECVVCLFV